MLYEASELPIVDRTCRFLKLNGFVKSESMFCQSFLRRSHGYLNMLRSLSREPSKQAMSNLRSRLLDLSGTDIRPETHEVIMRLIDEVDGLLATSR